MGSEQVLVTGGSGFIAAHCIVQLLNAGYRVRTTVRSPARETDVRGMLRIGGCESTEGLSFAVADLLSDAGWSDAVAGCDYVLHVASPVPFGEPKNEDDLIIPAREGALRVLRAARDGGVKRLVLTSSFAAIGYGQIPVDRPFSEVDWTDPDRPGISAYVKSKTLSERAAWDFIAREGGGLEMSAVNPVGVFGPVLGPDYSASIQIVQRMMDGGLRALPQLYFGVVDVRDIADLHVRAMTNPAANGERFLAVSGDFMTMQQIAMLLKSRMGEAAARVHTRVLPNWLLRFVALFTSSLKQVVPELGKVKNGTNEKARHLLGWAPRPREEAIIATAESLVKLGLLRDSKAGGG